VPRSHLFGDFSQPCSSERSAADIRNSGKNLRAEAIGDLIDVLGHVWLTFAFPRRAVAAALAI
jgi:hypothetical protein